MVVESKKAPAYRMKLPVVLTVKKANLADIKERDECSDMDASQSPSPLKTPFVDPRDDLLADEESDGAEELKE